MDSCDKKFAYIVISIFIITFMSLIVIDAIGDMAERVKTTSWYIYCDDTSCSCNMYGDAPIGQAVACMNFMQDYYSGESGIPNRPPIITSIEGTVQ